MKDENKTKAQLITELKEMRQYVSELEKNQFVDKRAEKEYRYLSAVVEQSTEGMAVADLEGKLIYVNNAWCKMHGYKSSEKLLGKNLAIFHTKEQLENDVMPFNQKVKEIGTHRGEIGHVTRDGQVFPTLMVTTLLKDEQGRPFALAGIAKDITERVRAEEDLKESKERFKSIFENATIGIYRTTPDGQILMANPALVSMLGYSSFKELAQRNLEKEGYEPGYPRSQFQEQIEREGQIIGQESAWQKNDGTTLFVRESSRAVRDKAGNTLYYEGTVEDITERKQAENALRESEERYRLLAENATDVIWTMDLNLRSTYTSPSVRRLRGYDAEDAMSQSLEEALTPESLEVASKALEEELAKEKLPDKDLSRSRTLEFEILRKDGSIIWVETTMTFLRDAEGYPTEILGVTRDITGRRQAEQALRDSQARLTGIIDSAMDAIVTLDADQRIILFNPAAERMFGCQADEVIGHTLDRFIPERYRKVHRKHIRLFGKTNQSSRSMGEGGTLTCLRSGGEEFLADITISQTEMAGQKIYTAILRDVTERERARSLQGLIYEIASAAVTAQSLDELYAKIHTLLQSLLPTEHFYIALYDQEKNLLSFPYFQDGFDTAPSPAKPGRGLTEYVLRTRKPLRATREVLDELTQKGEIELVGPDSIEWLGVPLLTPEKVIGVMAVQSYEEKVKFSVEDLDVMMYVSTQVASAIERKQAEQALREAETKYRTLVEQIPNAVTYIDSADPSIGTYYVSPQIENMVGFPPEEWIANPRAWHDHIHPEDHERILAADRHHDETGEPFGQEYRMIAKDGGEVWVHDAAIMLRDEAGVPQYSHGIMVDISEHKSAEQELNRRVAELSALYKTTLDIINVRNLSDLLDKILMRSVDLLGGSSGVLYLCDPESEQAQCVVSYKTSKDYTGTVLKYGEGAAGAVAATGEPLIVDEYHTWDGRAEVFEEEQPFAEMVSAPMLWKGQVIGVIQVLHDMEKRKFSEEDLNLLISFANQAAIAVKNTRLLEETQRRLEQISTLRHIDQAISSSLDLRVTLNILLGHILQQLEVDAAAVLLYRPELQMLEFVAGEGFHTQALQFTNLRLGEGFAGQAVLKQQTLHISDLGTLETGFLRSPKFRNENFVEYIGVPLIAKGNVVGVLEIYHRQSFSPDREWMAFLETLAGQAAIAIDNVRLFEDLQASNMQLRQAYDATIEGWARVLEMRDMETEGHSRRAVALTLDLARKMGIAERKLEHVRWGALLHDIGKMGIPDSIMQKPGPLTEEEWEIIRQHPKFAKKWLSPILYLKDALDIPYCHHEKWDGTGYPRGLKGEQIPLVARIFAVVDVWDALCSERPYRDAWPLEKVMAYLQEQAGLHFDPEVVDAFSDLLVEKGLITKND